MLQQEDYAHIVHDVIVTRVPPSDQILNALVRGASVALQLSIREGFEIKITECIIKGVPVIAYASGGIPHQVQHGVNGFLVDTGDVDTVAEYLYLLVKYPDDVFNPLRRACKRFCADEELFTVCQAINWLHLIDSLVDGTLAEKRNEALKKRRENPISMSKPMFHHDWKELATKYEKLQNLIDVEALMRHEKEEDEAIAEETDDEFAARRFRRSGAGLKRDTVFVRDLWQTPEDRLAADSACLWPFDQQMKPLRIPKEDESY